MLQALGYNGSSAITSSARLPCELFDRDKIVIVFILIQSTINNFSNIAIGSVSFYLTFLSSAVWHVPSPADFAA